MMRILHYTLGFEPTRSGGLVRYSTDLALDEAKSNKVFVLFPGNCSLSKAHVRIQKVKNEYAQLGVFELINSLPLAIKGGIKEPEKFMTSVDESVYKDFFRQIQPDVIHLHTLMGLHLEFFKMAKELEIPIVFTTHDYYGLGPDPTLYYDGKNFSTKCSALDWISISENSSSVFKLRIKYQNRFINKHRQTFNRVSKIVLCNRRKKRRSNNNNRTAISKERVKIYEYQKLIDYYREMFNDIDFYLFNSEVSYTTYAKILGKQLPGTIINVTSNAIGFDKKKPFISSDVFPKKIGFVGSYTEQKGFYDFVKLSTMLNTNDYSFVTFGDTNNLISGSKIKNYGKFSSKKIYEVYSNIDILIVPSKWNETFGFIGLEALSFGVPVITRKNVGMSSLVDDNFLYENIYQIPKMLLKISSYHFKKLPKISEHVINVENIYQKLLKP